VNVKLHVALPPAPDGAQLHTTGLGRNVPVVGVELNVTWPTGAVFPVGSVSVAVQAVAALTESTLVAHASVVVVASTEVSDVEPPLCWNWASPP
jgi:hypothetical protein